MKPLYFLAMLLLFAACKKDTTAPASTPIQYGKPDFALVPTHDAKWYIHSQGTTYCGDTRIGGEDLAYQLRPDEVDTAFHIYTTVEALGKDTVMSGDVYHQYSVTRVFHNTRDKRVDSIYQRYITKGRYYLMEDTLKKKVYNGYDSVFAKEYNTVLDFSDSANTGSVKAGLAWPQMNTVNADYIVAGQQLKGWDMRNIYDNKYQYFYKAIGIGSITGILPSYFVIDCFGQVRSLDFVYKGDSIHFDFPLQ
jgi:hypothetical protein